VGEPLRILVVEDAESDALLALRALRKGGIAVFPERVESAAALRAALGREAWDAIISDFHIPGFGGLEALAIVRDGGSDMPFILVSGRVGEEVAADAMRSGANDCVMKDNLVRLAPALVRELGAAAARAEHRRNREQLEASEARFRSLTALSSDWYWEQDEAFRFTAMSGGVLNKGNFSIALALGKTRWELPIEIDEGGWAAHKATLAARQPFYDFEYRIVADDGSRRWYSVSGEPVFDADGRFRGYWGTGNDITGRKVADLRIRRLSRIYAVLSGINSTIVRAIDTQELFLSACRIAVEEGGFAIAWIGQADGRSGALRIVAGHAADGQALEQVRELAASGKCERIARAMAGPEPLFVDDIGIDPATADCSRVGRTRSLAALPLVINGVARCVLALHAEATDVFDEEEKGLLAELAADIAFAMDHIAKARRLDFLACHDPLTGLANAMRLRERLDQFMNAARREGTRLALVLLDIERFKAVNDSLGRQAGDELLRQLARRLEDAVEPVKVARTGSNQFAVILTLVGGRETFVDAVVSFWRDCFVEPFRLAGTELMVGAKTGTALFPDDGIDVPLLVASAEAALKTARRSGERHVFHYPELTAGVAERLGLESHLRKALERDEFELHYQPKVDLHARRIVGVEALIRWRSPERGLVAPGNFIPLLEETGMILEVGAWAMSRAAADHARWRALGLPAPRVAVNVSAVQLRQDDFVATVARALAPSGAPAGVDLEITESVVMADVQAGIGKLEALRAQGIGIAIDDFGTGYSSLGYLARLPVTALKIDRSFIDRMLEEPNIMILVSTIISLAGSLRLGVVAEGVETEAQAQALLRLGCDEFQGFLFSRPVPFDAIGKMLA
jgi:diguanylate cyclase (GGDEF)-like protein/PAS domain S-box-containing protein